MADKRDIDHAKEVKLKDYGTNKVEDVNIGEYNKNGMLLFGANVQLARAIPDCIDGFKPLGRRAIYAMAKIGNASKKMQKALSLVGDIIKIHPHGDSSVEDIISYFSEEWELIYPLIDIKGNNGSAKGSEHAAARYLDAMLTEYAIDCYFKEWDNSLVELKQSYNPEYMEPEYLISRFPDLLLRPTTGFTFGVATNIPSFNLAEAFNEVIELIKNPEHEPVLIPDLPCKCIIVDEGKFPEICATGQGAFTMRAEIRIDEKNSTLIVESLPYKVILDDVMEKIDKMRKDGEIPNLLNMFDGSRYTDVNLRLKFSPGTDLKAMRNLLYKKTSLQRPFPTLMTYVNNYQILVMNLKQVMQTWIDNRRVIKRKYMIGKIVTIKDKLHILKVMIDICSNGKLVTEIINKIRKSHKDDIIDMLHKKYDISTLQAKSIANMKVAQFSASSLDEYKVEKRVLEAEIDEYEKLISKPKKIDKIIIGELEEAISKYNKPRMCRVVKYKKEGEFDSIPNIDYLLVFTKNSFIKKINAKKKDIGKLNEGDEPVETVSINNRDSVVLFDDKGIIHTLNVWDIPESDKNSKGLSISQFIRVQGKIVSVFAKSTIDKGNFIFITKLGMIKKTDVKNFSFTSSIISMVVKDGDNLVSVKYTKENNDVIIFTKKGNGTRFHTDEITATNRMTSGVIGINLTDDDIVLGMAMVGKTDTHFAIVTARGFGKMVELDDLNTTKRRGNVLRLIQLVPSDEVVDLIPCDMNSNFMVCLLNGSFDVCSDDFHVLTRNHYGKKMIGVRRGDMIVKFFRLV